MDIKCTPKIINMFRAIIGASYQLSAYKGGDCVSVQVGSVITLPMGFVDKYGFDKSRLRISDHRITGTLTSSIVLRDAQREFVSKVKLDQTTNYFILQCPCNFGKTILGVYLIYVLKYKTLVITTLKKILNQWKTSFESTNIRVYYSDKGISAMVSDMRSGVLDSYDVIICPDKHLKSDVFVEYVRSGYGSVIIDEIHSYNFANCNNVNKFLYNNHFKYCIGLSATPSSTNRIHFFTTYAINVNSNNGNIYNIDMLYKPELISSHKYKYDLVKNNMIKKIDISKDASRNSIICEIIEKYGTRNTRALILTDFRNHAGSMYALLRESKNVFLYDVERPDNDLLFDKLLTLESYYLIATCKSSIQGLDVKNLNTLHILLPITSSAYITQAVGRIREDDRNVFFYSICNTNIECDELLQRSINTIKTTFSKWDFHNKYVTK